MIVLRLVTLCDGAGMGGELIVFETDAPVEELKRLEQISCQIFHDGRDSNDVPIWADVLANKGYTLNCINSHVHASALATSSEWLEKTYPFVTEHYVIEDQPFVK